MLDGTILPGVTRKSVIVSFCCSYYLLQFYSVGIYKKKRWRISLLKENKSELNNLSSIRRSGNMTFLTILTISCLNASELEQQLSSHQFPLYASMTKSIILKFQKARIQDNSPDSLELIWTNSTQGK